MNIMNEDARRSRSGKSHYKKRMPGPRTDMTPMVDLGFLLIAFFIMTTTLSKPAVLDLNMPADTNKPGTTIGKSNVLTVLLGGPAVVFYYEGSWDDALRLNAVRPTSLFPGQGLGSIIRAKQLLLQKMMISKEGKDGLMLLIKATNKTNYQMVIDALDEALINSVKKYALIKPDDAEKQYINTHK